MALEFLPSDKLTFETDDRRFHDNPSIVKDKHGRLVVFYQKYLYSGRLTGGDLSFGEETLNCSISAGTGELNGTDISWPDTNLTLQANSDTLVYADIDGAVKSTTEPTMTLTKDVVMLSYVNVGSIIVRAKTVQSGYYIYNRRQEFINGSYAWDDKEYKICTGVSPYAAYDGENDRIYLSYQMNGSSCLRIFDLNNSSTFRDQWHYHVGNEGEISPKPQPKEELFPGFGVSSGRGIVTQPELFSFGRSIGIGYKYENGEYVPYVHLPYTVSEHLDYIIGNPILQVLSKNGDSYSVIAEYSINKGTDLYNGLNTKWTYGHDNMYLRLKVNHLLFNNVFYTDTSNYMKVLVPETRDYLKEKSESKIDFQVRDAVVYPSYGVSEGKLNKTFESNFLYKFPSDNLSNISYGISDGKLTKTEELFQDFKFSEDSLENISYGVSEGKYTITNKEV